MCPGHGVKTAQKEKEKHPGPVVLRGKHREEKTSGRSGHGLIKLLETPEVIGRSLCIFCITFAH